jgi:hypothetical protein
MLNTTYSWSSMRSINKVCFGKATHSVRSQRTGPRAMRVTPEPEPEPDRRKIPNAALCCTALTLCCTYLLPVINVRTYAHITLLGDDRLILIIITYITSASGEKSKASTLPPCQKKNDTLFQALTSRGDRLAHCSAETYSIVRSIIHHGRGNGCRRRDLCPEPDIQA